MDWRTRVANKLSSPEDIAALVKSGDVVHVATYLGTPFAICRALHGRRHDLKHVRIDHFACNFDWLSPNDAVGAFDLHDIYATEFDRVSINAGAAEYLPVSVWREGELPPGFAQEPDVFMVTVSPPDDNGYCSFGLSVSFSPTLCRVSKVVVAEVHEEFVRTAGQNYVHISQIDRFCEADPQVPGFSRRGRSKEQEEIAHRVCAHLTDDLVRDGDTLQIGWGTVSEDMPTFLKDKSDLGIQTEIIPNGIPSLVAQGVINGSRKTLHRGKAIGSSFLPLSAEELAIVDGNPAFELLEFNYTDDVRMLMQQDNLVAINNALFVDLTGQVASEGIGPSVYSGVGGQTAFMVAAQYARGGRSIVVVPASHVVSGERVTRIVPMLPEGSLVTVPRTFVDFVVTEYGVATLRGKTVRERIGELVAISHPDHKAELKLQARKLYGISV